MADKLLTRLLTPDLSRDSASDRRGEKMSESEGKEMRQPRLERGAHSLEGRSAGGANSLTNRVDAALAAGTVAATQAVSGTSDGGPLTRLLPHYTTPPDPRWADFAAE